MTSLSCIISVDVNKLTSTQRVARTAFTMTDFNQKNIVVLSAVSIAHPSEFDSSVNIKKNVFSKELNFAYSVRPIYYFARVFGLFPYTIVHDTNDDIKEARVTFIDICWFVLSICVYLFLAIYCYENLQLPTDPNVSYVLILGDYSLLILGLIFGAAVIVADMYNRNKFMDIMKKFNSFDKEVR